ncbi:MAG: hypothetical protein HZA51_00090 [Planctomycetes bacterium]|nr:hypothetical protein [Planctomycetota bacterium]
MRLNVSKQIVVCAVALTSIGLMFVAPTFAGTYMGCPGTTNPGPVAGPDVIVGTLCHDAITNFNSAAISGVTYEAFSMGTTSCNIGTVHLNWIDEGNNPNHPAISQNFYRLKNINGTRRFEQLAQAWLKHGFCALCGSACCTDRLDESCDHLGVGCSDPYSSSRNGSQTANMGPKWQINATTGIHPEPRANPGGATSTTVSRRMHIPVTELEVSNGTGDVNATRYWGESQYVAADDAAAGNKNNNASYRPINVSGSGSAWSFSALGTTQRQQCGIRAWADTDTTVTDPATITRVVETDMITPEDNGDSALVIIAAQATNLGNGLWHYEYAVQNLNSDRSVSSVSIPVSSYLTVSNIGFRDVAYWDGDGEGNVTIDGTDWPGSHANGAVTWACTQTYAANHNANALRWGTMYNFRFDCNEAPPYSHGDTELVGATFGQFKPNAQSFVGDTVAPASVTCVRGDMNNDGLIDAGDIARFSEIIVNGAATPREKCAGDLEAIADFGVDLDDTDNFANCLLNGGGC